MRNPTQIPYPPNQKTQTNAYCAVLRMVGRLLLAPLMVSLILPLSGCEQSPSDAETAETDPKLTPELALKPASELPPSTPPTAEVVDSVSTSSTRSQQIQIDWSRIDSKVKPIDPASFAYSMAIDSAPVTAYAEYFGVTASEARHSLTLGTASNEPLDALLTQLGDSYLSHQLTDGNDIKLIIHTTSNVSASQHDYVIAGEFARGLVLPIVIEPQVD